MSNLAESNSSKLDDAVISARFYQLEGIVKLCLRTSRGRVNIAFPDLFVISRSVIDGHESAVRFKLGRRGPAEEDAELEGSRPAVRRSRLRTAIPLSPKLYNLADHFLCDAARRILDRVLLRLHGRRRGVKNLAGVVSKDLMREQ
jgi:hypothetical protein